MVGHKSKGKQKGDTRQMKMKMLEVNPRSDFEGLSV